ncbi:MAG: hypothetical protein R2824_13010 [Saprospiraceae bacterium]|nr:hypothetical protein [Lewinella sp.]
MNTQPKAVSYPGGSMSVQLLDNFFNENRSIGQTFVIDPTRRTTLVGNRGTRLTIPANSFKDLSGWPVNEPVKLFLKEIFTRPQMIISGLTNTSEDRILESAGQLYLKAESEGRSLKLAAPVSVDIPLMLGVDNPLASQLFSGGISQTSSFGSGHRFDWKLSKQEQIQLKTLGGKKYLNFPIGELNWWNCTSFFHRRRNRVMLSVRWTAGTELPAEDIAAFLVFRDFNAVIRMYPGRHGFSSWNIPKGLYARIVLIGMSGEQMMIGQSPWALTDSYPISIEMENCSKVEALANIMEWTS